MDTMNKLIDRYPNAAGNFSKFLRASAISISIGLFTVAAAQARDLSPEVVSRVWLDGGQQVASVELNGDEVIRFKADDDDDDAAEEAEDLAIKLQEIIADKKFDPTLLIPVKDEDRSVIKYDGETILDFDPFAGKDDNSSESDEKRFARAFDASSKIVNALRTALGAPALPSCGDLADKPGSKLDLLGRSFSGAASWYGGRFNGRKCSDGTRFSEHKLTAAHRSLPFGTKLLVKNRKTGDTVVVEVNDRGPFIDGRVIDVSKAAARQLNMVSSGIAYVECTILQ